MKTTPTKNSVAVMGGNYRYCNLYTTPVGQVACNEFTHDSLEAARSARRKDGTYICTIKISTKVEVA